MSLYMYRITWCLQQCNASADPGRGGKMKGTSSQRVPDLELE